MALTSPRRRSLRRSLRLRALRFWLPRLKRRALFLFGGIAVGGLAVAMARLADGAQALFAGVTARQALAPLLVTPAGFAAAAWLARRHFPNSGGSGIPQVIAAHGLDDPALRDPLVSPRVAAGKILLLVLGLACGASSGREGPTVQVGASVMYALGRLAPHRQPGLLVAGSAAGIAAAFNAPLAGIIFAIEEMSRSFETRTSGLILGTVIAAGLTSLALVGDYTYFGRTSDLMPFGPEWLAVPVVGVAGGLCGGLFSRILIASGRGVPGAAGRAIRGWPVPFAALCGLGVALCGVGSANSVFGTGYEQARAILHGTSDLPASFGPLKFLATVLSSVSGIPGGIFAPSLAVGAGLAADLRGFLPATPIGVLTVLGMVSYLSGVVQAPITSFVIVDEMTANHALVLAILIGVAIRTAWTPGVRWMPGIAFSAKILLEVAVVMLGASVSAATVLALGPLLILGIAAVVAVAIASSYGISRVLGLPRRMAILVACGNSICGNSAIAAVAPVVGADGDDVAASIAFTAVLGVAVVLGLPLLVPILRMSLTQYGVLAGLTVYAVPQVLAATLPIGALSNQVGTVVKLVRVLMLGPVVLALSLLTRRMRDELDEAAPAITAGDRPSRGRPALHQLVPWFIVGFLVVLAVRSFDLIPALALSPIAATASLLTTVSMAALGLGVDVRVVARAGLRVTAAVTLSLVVLGIISFALIRALGVG